MYNKKIVGGLTVVVGLIVCISLSATSVALASEPELPDLTLNSSDFNYSYSPPGIPLENDILTMNVTITVRNIGNATAENVNVSLYDVFNDSQNLIYSWNITRVPIGENITNIKFNWTVPITGNIEVEHRLRVVIDPNDEINESNESNNVAYANESIWVRKPLVHNLNTGEDFATIQAAIDDPDTKDEHTITVDAWTYCESVVVNKSLTLLGENRDITIIDGNGSGNVVTITSDDVNISRFTIRNSGPGGNDAGIHVVSNNNTISNNRLTHNNQSGIRIVNSSNNLIYNNYFNNTNNAWDDGNDTWNITKTGGMNIIGESYLGGNYWSDYAGEDLDGDGLGDTLLPYKSSGNITNGGDYLPLVIATAKPTPTPSPTPAAGGGGGGGGGSVAPCDTDGDGLIDTYELTIGTDPFNPDTDGDGLSDLQELIQETDPTNPDTDGDGINDSLDPYPLDQAMPAPTPTPIPTPVPTESFVTPTPTPTPVFTPTEPENGEIPTPASEPFSTHTQTKPGKLVSILTMKVPLFVLIMPLYTLLIIVPVVIFGIFILRKRYISITNRRGTEK